LLIYKDYYDNYYYDSYIGTYVAEFVVIIVILLIYIGYLLWMRAGLTRIENILKAPFIIGA